MTEQMGYGVRMTIAGTAVEFVSHDIKETIEIVEDEGIRGSRTRVLERVAMGNKKVAGSLTMEPTPAEMSLILPFVTNSGNAVSLTDTMQDVTIVIDNITKKYTYLGRFTSLHITGESGKKIQLKLQFVGKTLTVATGGTLTGTPDITARPYMFYDAGSGLTLASTTYQIDKFDLGIDNKIEPTFMQGQTATDLEPTDRVVTLGVQTKYTATESNLFDLAQAGPTIGTPLTGAIAFTNGSNSMTWTFGALVAASESVVVPNKKPLRLPLNYHSYGVSTTKEVVPTLV